MSTIVIFGGTGGIGSALARQLTAVGCRIALVARDEGRLESLGRELGADICRANAADSTAVERCFAPGLTRTPLTASLTRNELTLKASAALHPPGRIGEPDEVASAIRWFLSPEQGWVTGQVPAVDGGLSALQARTTTNP